MSLISAVPSGVYVSTGNGQVCLNWQLVAGATSYSVQRSVDQITWATLTPAPTVPQFVDTTCLIGTLYYYQIASVSSAGTSGYQGFGTNGLILSIIPCAPGQINLGYLRYESKLRADLLQSNFITNDEWNLMINQSAKELYDVLVCKFGEDYYLAPPLIIVSSGLLLYPLPNGTNYKNTNGIPDPNGQPAPACYKVHGMDYNCYGAQVTNQQGWVSMSRFMFADRNKFSLLFGAALTNTAGQFYNAQFREMGSDVYILPTNSGQSFRLWYVPLSQDLLKDNDMISQSYSGWWEYITVDAASKALEKQEFFEQANALLARKDALLMRIETTAANRNVGQPNVATNSRNSMGDPNFSGPSRFGGFGMGFGGGYGY